MHRNLSHRPRPSVVEPRRELLVAVRSFVRAACNCPGVLRIALMGSLVTSKAIPKDADVLVTINGMMDLGELARWPVASAIIASAIHAWHVSPSIAGAASTSMTTFMSSRYRKNCLPRRQLTFGQMLSADSRCRLM